MNKFGVSDKKADNLKKRMEAFEIKEEDIKESFVKGSGPGGQKINKSSTCVQLQHLPTGMKVRCQAARSLALNRFMARRILCDRIEEKKTGEIAAEKAVREKIRRQKRKRSRHAKEKILKDKKIASEKKRQRKILPRDME